jgi:peroxiredoxin
MRWIELGRACQESLAPGFRLPVTTGGEVTRAQFRQRAQLVLLFLPEIESQGARGLLEEVERLGPKLRQAEAKVYVVSSNPGSQVAPIPVLNDRESVVRDQYAALLPPGEQPGNDEPFIVILDRYGAPAHAARGPLDREGIAAEILDWLKGIQHECPE